MFVIPVLLEGEKRKRESCGLTFESRRERAYVTSSKIWISGFGLPILLVLSLAKVGQGRGKSTMQTLTFFDDEIYVRSPSESRKDVN